MLSHSDIQKALSARIDGEVPGIDDAVVDAHLAQCGECAAFWDRSLALSRSLSFVEADTALTPPADLTDVIVAGVESEFRRRLANRAVALAVNKVVLAIVAALHTVWAAKLVISAGKASALALNADPALAPLFVGAAAVRVGIAAALLFVCWKPAQIPGVLLIVGAMFGFSLSFAVLDAVSGSGVAPWREMTLLTVTALALACMWVLDRGMRNPLTTLNSSPQR